MVVGNGGNNVEVLRWMLLGIMWSFVVVGNVANLRGVCGKVRTILRYPHCESFHVSRCMNNSVPLESILCCLLYTSPSPRDGLLSRMPSSA